MLSFTNLCDLKLEVKHFIGKLRHDKLSSGNSAEPPKSPEGDESFNVRIIGQEQDRLLLYTWDEHAELDKELPEVTHFGAYDTSTKTNKEIFCHDKKVHVVNCTINQEHTLMGFVTVEAVEVTGQQGKIQRQNVYRAFLAEIQPRNRLFSLDLQRENHLQLQFLYGDYKPKTTAKESHLLVLLHGESIGLYHLPVAITKQGGVLMTGQPRKEQIYDKRFTWWQWQCSTQSLYVARHRKQGRNNRGKSVYQCVLICYQFNSVTTNEFKVEFPINFDIPNPRYHPRPKYFDAGPSHIIPDYGINMKVLSQQNGSLCLCYQHITSAEQTKKQGDTCGMQYSIVLVHHGRVLNGQCSHLPKQVAETARLSFFWMGDYIAVHLAGYFIHLLNVASDLEPSHHLLWHDAEAFSKEEPQTLGPVGAGLFNLSQDGMVFDPSSSVIHTVSVDHGELLTVFRDANISVRQAILHYAVVHARDLGLIKQLFDVLSKTPTQPELTEMLEEFLVGAAFTNIQRYVNHRMLQVFPFTLAQVFRGQVANGEGKSRLANLTYSNLGQVTFGNLTSKVPNEQDAFWESVSRVHHKQSAGVSSRFCNLNVRLSLDSRNSKEAGASDTSSSSQATKGLFGRLGAAAKSAFSNLAVTKPLEEGVTSPGAAETKPLQATTASNVLGPPPEFLSRPHDASTEKEQGPYIAQTVDLLTNHLWRCQEIFDPKKSETKTRLRNIAEDYVRCQLHQSKLLCHLIWSVLGSQGQSHDLFLMLEKYYLATRELSFPQPAGFQLYFTSLAFHCMDFRLFLQYADLGVLQVTLDFAIQLLRELDDSQQNAEIKLQVIKRLPKEFTVECLRRWHHPVAQRYLACHYAAVCLSDESSIGWEMYPRTKATSPGGVNAPIPDPHVHEAPSKSTSAQTHAPVSAFVRMLESYDPGLATAESIGGLEIDSQFMERTSLLEMHSQE